VGWVNNTYKSAYFIIFIIIIIIIIILVGFKVSLSSAELNNFAVYSLWGTPGSSLLF
jgi:hypothetical protein